MGVEEILDEIVKVDNSIRDLNKKIEIFYKETPNNLLEMSEDVQVLLKKIEDNFTKGTIKVKDNRKTYEEISNKILLSPELVTIAEMRIYHRLKEVYK